jgi:uncharacterized protein (TIGR02594 family)
MGVREIQQALAQAGFDPGHIDGIRGRKTIKAIKDFQQANGLEPDGISGPLTIAKLFPGRGQPLREEDFSVPSHMPWLQEAFNLIGTREKPGAGSNEAIIGWAQALSLLSYDDDDIPWCGLFAAHCIGSQLPEEPLPNNPLGARQWEKFGHIEQGPCLGAVMVFWRESKQSGKGHVGFYWAEDDDAYHILGGNQSDSVSVARLSKGRFIATRWPNTAENPTPVKRIANVNGQLLSQNEV